MPIRILEHTADIGLEATADDLEGAFAELIRGFGHLVLPDGAADGLGNNVTWSMHIQEDDLVRLAVEVIDHLILDFDVDQRIPASAHVRLREANQGGWDLQAEVKGEVWDEERHGHPMDIKAATLHEAVADRHPPKLQIIVDI